MKNVRGPLFSLYFHAMATVTVPRDPKYWYIQVDARALRTLFPTLVAARAPFLLSVKDGRLGEFKTDEMKDEASVYGATSFPSQAIRRINLMRRNIYVKKYNERPDVKDRRRKRLNDPIAKEKRREYLRRPEVKEARKLNRTKKMEMMKEFHKWKKDRHHVSDSEKEEE